MINWAHIGNYIYPSTDRIYIPQKAICSGKKLSQMVTLGTADASELKPKKEYNKNIQLYQFAAAVQLILRLYPTTISNKYNYYRCSVSVGSIAEISEKIITFGPALPKAHCNQLCAKDLQTLIRKAEDWLFIPNIHSVVVAELVRAYKNQLSKLTLKEIWYCVYPLLSTPSYKNYDNSIARELLCCEDQTLANLVPSSANKEAIESAIQQTLGRRYIRSAYWKQIEYILRAAEEWRYVPNNPFKMAWRNVTQLRKVHKPSFAPIRKCTFEPEEEFRIVKDAITPTYIPELQKHVPLCVADSHAMGRLFAVFCGNVTRREMCALDWSDMHHLAEDMYTCYITKYVSNEGVIIPYTLTPENIRKKRKSAFAPFMTHLLLQRIHYLQNVYQWSREEIFHHPIFLECEPPKTKRKHQAPKRCSLKTAKKIHTSLIDIAEISRDKITLLENENEIAIDLGISTYELLMHNHFDFAATHLANLSSGAIAYLFGNRPNAVTNRNYIGYDRDIIQIQICRELHRWTAKYEALLNPQNAISYQDQVQINHHITKTIVPPADKCADVIAIIQPQKEADQQITVTAESSYGHTIHHSNQEA